MKKLNLVFIAGLTASSVFFTSCSNDDDTTIDPEETGEFSNGVFILNEGNFGSSNASVSFFGDNGVLQNGIFQSVNGESLGDTAQNIFLDEDKAYIVLNGSGKIEVVNRYSFERLGTVSSGLANPRYFITENGKGYVSNWGDPSNPEDDYIAVIDLGNYTVSATIPVVEGPDRLEADNGKIYVAHSGGWNYGNTVSVINASNNSISSTITVHDYPNSLLEENGVLYVLCGGKPAWTGEETTASLYKINTADNSILTSLEFPVGQHPTNLEEEEGNLYFTLDATVFKTEMGTTTLPPNPLFDAASQGVFGIYGFAVENGKIYVGDAGDFVSNGKVFIYSNSGNLLNELSAGFLPNGFASND